jgi:DNA gyrase/topoisomerase IV subunit B
MSKNISKKISNWLDANVEDKYSKKDELEHILELPDTQIGSTEFTDYNFWIPNDEDDISFLKQDIRFTPGLYKIIDEILVNAYDQAIRLKEIAKKIIGKNELDEDDLNETGIDFVKNLKINIDCEKGMISVFNDGEGIDVAKHKEHKVYVPQMIFGDMRTSSNYNKNETGIQIVGGRNGFGAKLANIFSTKFIVETVDARRKLKFCQEYEKNMTIRHEPVIKKSSAKAYTKITFYPDLERFGYTDGIDDSLHKLILKRAYDLAACTEPNINVYINDEKIDCKTFEKYVCYYLGNKSQYPRVYKKFDERWEVVACLSPNQKFDQVSFANGVSTIRGGKHVDYISKQIITKLRTFIQNKKKFKTLKAEHVKDNIMVFLKCSINNAAFDTQTKECLTTTSAKFGSICVIDDNFIETLAIKCGVMEQVFSWHELKTNINLKKTDGSNKGRKPIIPKLDDAGWAGSSKNAQNASLILTEGDSAKTLAMAGRGAVKNEKGESIGHQMYGVFPLRGKVLNVDGVSAEKIIENKEITYLKQILGLQEGKVYKDTKSLRYGSIMIMTDQDSVTGDTPLLLKNDGYIEIHTIENLSNDWKLDANGKDYGSTNKMIWTETGWTNIKHIMRHKVNKKMYRVLTHTGVVDVTEDHSLLNEFGQEISPNDCEIGVELLHSFPKFGSTRSEYLSHEKRLNYRKLGNYWRKNNHKKYYIRMSHPKNFINKFLRDRQEYVLGMLNCNGLPTYLTINMMLYNKYDAQCIYVLFRSVGYNVYIDNTGGSEAYIINITSKKRNNPNRIKKIFDLGTTEQYVYDLETTNHHFQAGIGQMIVHNTDGSHIKGLLINLFKTKWPSLFEMPGFMTSLLTPVIKASKGGKTKKIVKSFYSIPQYDQWSEKNNNGKGWNVKYYKGLGTSTPKEGKEYFEEMRKNIYTAINKEEAFDKVDMAFNKKRADDRKVWLHNGDTEILDYSKTEIPYKDFIDKDLIHFSHSDNRRSIPSMVDGLKESQRKILFGIEKKPGISISNGIKVAQIAGYIAEHSAYHHGEVSLHSTICSMAQDFVGSNNINLLTPLGQFGSRLKGGKDSASPRYIFTKLESITEHIFNKLDKPLYNYLTDDGDPIEPEYYVPIIPSILINGCKGIGTGYSTSVPCYNPEDVIKSIRDLMNDIQIEDLIPWYRGFKGYITKSGPLRYLTRGIYKQLDSSTIEITELPIGTWTENYKNFLIGLTGEKIVIKKSPKSSNFKKKDELKKEDDDKSNKIPKMLKKFDEAHTDTTVHFTLYFEDNVLDQLLSGPPDKKGINLFEKTFKLTSSIATSNMILYDNNNCLKKYNNTTEIIEDFYDIRLQFYVKRRKFILSKLKEEKLRLTWKAKFILSVISDDTNDKIYVSKRSKKNIYEQLEKKHFPKEINKKLIKLSHIENMDDQDNETAYNYLLNMSIYSLTEELVKKLLDDKEKIDTEYYSLKEKTPLELWKIDLDELEVAYKTCTKHYWKEQGKETESQYWDVMKKKAKRSKKFKTKIKMIESDEE